MRWRLGACSSGMRAHMTALRRGCCGSKRLGHNSSRLMHLLGSGMGGGEERGWYMVSRWPLLKTRSEW